MVGSVIKSVFRAGGRKVSVRPRQVFWGAILSYYVVAALVIFAVPAVVRAANPLAHLGACFTRQECLGTAEGSGNCTDDFCFSPGEGKCSAPQGVCYAKSPPVDLTISIGGTRRALDLGHYIELVYKYAVNVAAVLATVMFMIGGLLYLTSGGDSGRVGVAKKRMTDAVIGLVLTLGAYLLLNTVNPNLVKLDPPMIPLMKGKVFVECMTTEMCAPCGQKYGLQKPEDPNAQWPPKTCVNVKLVKNADDEANYDLVCPGKACSKKATDNKCSILTHKCKLANEGEEDECGLPEPSTDSGGDKWICKGCKFDGQSCGPPLGKTDECCGGFCADGECTTGYPGDPCEEDSDCRSGICQSGNLFIESCSDGEVGSPCGEDEECKDGKCTFGSCIPGNRLNKCSEDEDCRTGSCHAPGSYVCLERESMPPGYENCKTDADCEQIGLKYCFTGQVSFCANGEPGDRCIDDNDCYNRRCLEGGQLQFCGSGAVGSLCQEDDDCDKAAGCYKEGDFGVCVSGELGSRCDGKEDCKGDMKCTAKQCVE